MTQREDKEAVGCRDALRKLAEGQADAPLAARFRALLPDIESAIARGVPHRTIVATLADGGLPMSVATFRTYLRRSRNRNRAANGATPPAALAPTATAPTSTAPARPPRPGPMATKAERDAWSASVIGDGSSGNQLLDKLNKKRGEKEQ